MARAVGEGFDVSVNTELGGDAGPDEGDVTNSELSDNASTCTHTATQARRQHKTRYVSVGANVTARVCPVAMS